MSARPRLGLLVTSPWGSVNRLKTEVNPEITVDELKSLIQKEMGLQTFEITIEEQVPGNDWGKDLISGTLSSNGVANNATITVVSAKQYLQVDSFILTNLGGPGEIQILTRFRNYQRKQSLAQLKIMSPKVWKH